MKDSERVRAGIAVLQENDWVQGSYARTSLDGSGVYPWDEDAVCFCALGAITKGTLPENPTWMEKQDTLEDANALNSLFHKISKEYGDKNAISIITANDKKCNSKEEAIAMMTTFAERLEERGQ